MNHDGEKPWTRQLLVAVGALVAVALVIGGVVSAFALGAAKVSGIGGTSSTSTSEPSLVIPRDSADPGATSKAAPSSRAPSPKPGKKRPAITLRVEPATVGAGQRINLTGDYAQGDGAELQVQRLEGAWTDFPVTTSVDGGRFSTYIMTSRVGDTRLRLLDKASGRASNVVRVVVG